MVSTVSLGTRKGYAVMPEEGNVNIICGRNVVMEVHDKMRIGGVR